MKVHTREPRRVQKSRESFILPKGLEVKGAHFAMSAKGHLLKEHAELSIYTQMPAPYGNHIQCTPPLHDPPTHTHVELGCKGLQHDEEQETECGAPMDSGLHLKLLTYGHYFIVINSLTNSWLAIFIDCMHI